MINLMTNTMNASRVGSSQPPSQSDLVLWGDGAFRQVGYDLPTDYINLTTDKRILHKETWCLTFSIMAPPQNDKRPYMEADAGVKAFFGVGSSNMFPYKGLRLYFRDSSYTEILSKVYASIELFDGKANKLILKKENKYITITLNGQILATEYSNNPELEPAEFARIGASGASGFDVNNLNALLWDFDLSGLAIPLNQTYDGNSDVFSNTGEKVGDLLGNAESFWSNKLSYKYGYNGVLKDIAGTYNLNLYSDATLTTLGFTNAHLTRTQLDSLHNGTTIFTSPDDGIEPRVLAWPAGKVLTATEILIANIYVRRLV